MKMKVLKSNEDTKAWLRAHITGHSVGVDRENNVIRGFVVAQEGVFKSEGRGEFDLQSLRQIVKLMKNDPKGLKSRFAHPTLSDDGIGKFLGRAKNPKLDGDRVRADLFLDPTSFDTPSGNIGKYVMDLAASDSDALSSSLVLQAEELVRLNEDGTRKEDEDGDPLPPIWRPIALHASDIVDTGDAVDGLLSDEWLPDSAVRDGVKLLDGAFSNKGETFIRSHCEMWLNRYLGMRFKKSDSDKKIEAVIERMKKI